MYRTAPVFTKRAVTKQIFVIMTCADLLSKSDEKYRITGEVGFILLRELCLSLPGFQETGNSLTLLCGVFVYQIPQESVKKYGH